jgi:hypothetical protein
VYIIIKNILVIIYKEGKGRWESDGEGSGADPLW